MKAAEVRKIKTEKDYPGMQVISDEMDKLKERLQIDMLNWKDYNYKPDVSLAIAYSVGK